MNKLLYLAVILVLSLTACATTPPNTILFSISSMPEGAAVFGSQGLLGIAPVTLLRPLTPANIAAGRYDTEPFTIKWVSGAEHVQAISFTFPKDLNRVGGDPTIFPRPQSAPDLFRDIEYAELRKRRLAETAAASEEQKRREDGEAAAGWLILAQTVSANRGAKQLPPLLQSKPTVTCTSQKMLGIGNPVETVCR